MAKVAIIGGGIAGISAAVFLRQAGHVPVVFEKEAELGGCIKTIQKDGYTLECGPNTVLQNTEGFKELIKALDLEKKMLFPNEEAAQNRFVVKNRKLNRVPAKPPEFISNKLISFSAKLRMLYDLFLSKSERDMSVADFVRRRFGTSFYEYFLNPFVTGIYAGDPEKMSTKYSMKLLWEMEQNHGSVVKGLIQHQKAQKGKPKSKMFQLEGGLKTIFNTFEEKRLAEVRKSTAVEKLEKDGNAYVLTFNGQTERFESIILTCPSYVAEQLVQDVFLKKELSKVEYVPIRVMHFGFDKGQVKEQIPGFGSLTMKQEKMHFLGLLFNSRIFHQVAPNGKELFTAIVGGARSPEYTQMPLEDLKAKILGEMDELLGIDGKPEFFHLWEKEKAIPQYAMNHEELMNSVEKYEQECKGIHILGNYLRGISVGDCIQKSFEISRKTIA